MAQHYLVDLQNEPKLQKSLSRIGEYLARSYNRQMLEREAGFRNWIPIMHKEILSFSNYFAKEMCESANIEYDNHFFFTIRFYNLEDKNKQFEKWGKNAILDVIADKNGKIIKCYYPL